MSAEQKHMPGPKPPRRLRAKAGETFADTRRRWLARWAEYRDATVIRECAFQATVCHVAKKRHFYRAFYGVQGEFIVAAMKEPAPAQSAWETAMGMRGYAGSPAEREDRVAIAKAEGRA